MIGGVVVAIAQCFDNPPLRPYRPHFVFNFDNKENYFYYQNMLISEQIMRIQEIYKYPFYEFYHTLIGKHHVYFGIFSFFP